MCVCMSVCVCVCVLVSQSVCHYYSYFIYIIITIFIANFITFSLTIKKGEKGFNLPDDAVASQNNQTKNRNQNQIPVSNQKGSRPILAAECVVAGGDKGHIRMWRPHGTNGFVRMGHSCFGIIIYVMPLSLSMLNIR